MKNTLLSFCFLLITWSGVAQISYEEQLDYTRASENAYHVIYTFGELGFIKKINEKKKYELYDPDFKLKSTVDIILSKGFEIIRTSTTDTRLHILASKTSPIVGKNINGDYELLTLDVESMKVTKVKWRFSKASYGESISIIGDQMFFSVVLNRVPSLHSINWKTGKRKVIPRIFPEMRSSKVSFIGFDPIPEKNEILLYFQVRNKKKVNGKLYEFFILIANEQGEKKDIIHFTKGVNQKIINIDVATLDDGKYLFTGNHKDLKLYKPTTGVFSCQRSVDKVDYIKFYDYSTFENFYNYLPFKRGSKKEKMQSIGNCQYDMYMHEAVLLDDGYLLVGELYDEVQVPQNTGNVSATIEFDYTHALLVKFNNDGEVVWSMVLEMRPNNELIWFVGDFLAIAKQNEKTVNIVYVNRNHIIGKTINLTDGTILKESKIERIDLASSESDELIERFLDVTHYYGNYFMADGRQHFFNNKDSNVDNQRTIDYFIKIKFE